MKKSSKPFIPSVNFHLWQPCNMSCKFCFATFNDVKRSVLPKGHLPKEQAIQVVRQLADFGFSKITFAGGEPTLCPWLSDLIATAKESNITTMIVSNGSKLTDAFLETNLKKLDWIALSIDSLIPETNLQTGRVASGAMPLSYEYYKTLAEKVKKYGYGLKINTVINRTNYQEDMNDFIRIVHPKRWKVLQVLSIIGQNDNKVENFKISRLQFQTFLDNHSQLSKEMKIVSETNQQVLGSYVMVDPAGRFFDNSLGTHYYSKPILEVGIKNAIKEVNYSFRKFLLRGGIYDWTIISTQNH